MSSASLSPARNVKPGTLSVFARDVRRSVSSLRGETVYDYAKKVVKALWSKNYRDHSIDELVDGDDAKAIALILAHEDLIAQGFHQGASPKDVAALIARSAKAALYRAMRRAAERLTVGERVVVEGDERVWTLNRMGTRGRGVPYLHLVNADGWQMHTTPLRVHPAGDR